MNIKLSQLKFCVIFSVRYLILDIDTNEFNIRHSKHLNVELSLLIEIAFDIRDSTNLTFGLNLIKAI